MTETDFYINLANSVSATFFVSGNELNKDVLTKRHLILAWQYVYHNMVYSLAYYYKDYLYNPSMKIEDMIIEVRDYLVNQNCSDVIYSCYHDGHGRQNMVDELLNLFQLLGKHIFNEVVKEEYMVKGKQNGK